MKLYELADQYKALQNANEEGFEVALDQLKDAIEDKAENIGKLWLSLQSNVEAIKSEEKRLADRREALENKAERLRDYLKRELELAGIDKVKRDTVTVSLRSNPPSVNILSEDAIPKEFWRIIPARGEWAKKDIISHWKITGNPVPGVEIVTNKKSVVIR